MAFRGLEVARNAGYSSPYIELDTKRSRWCLTSRRLRCCHTNGYHGLTCVIRRVVGDSLQTAPAAWVFPSGVFPCRSWGCCFQGDPCAAQGGRVPVNSGVAFHRRSGVELCANVCHSFQYFSSLLTNCVESPMYFGQKLTPQSS